MNLLILAKKIYSMNSENEYFTSMSIENNIIKDLNNIPEEQIDFERFDEVYRYPNEIIVPGFNDSHIHVLGYAKNLEHLNLVGCNNKEKFMSKISKKVETTSKGTWILGRGWDHEKFEGNEYPTKNELDSISKDHPIFLHRICGHIAVVNSSALSISSITNMTQNPKGGIIDRNEIGELTGILRETAIKIVSSFVPKANFETNKKNLRSALKKLNSYGITSVQTNDGNVRNLYESLNEKMTVRIFLTPFIEELDDLIAIGAKTDVPSDKMIRWGRIKIYSDGSLGGETAAMKEPYIDSYNKGVLIYSEKNLHKLIKKAHDHGWQLETHAIGDYAAEVVINAYEESGSFKYRSVLTHCQILNESLIERMRDLGIIANIQPVFINTDLYWAEKKIGKKRMKYSYAWKTLLDHNVKSAGGSDAPVEHPNPILGIHAAVNRQDNLGNPKDGWYPEQALSVYEAVKLFTVNSAYAEFQENQKGRLKEGMFADFIILDRDIFTIPKKELRNTKVNATFVNGKKVFTVNSE